jgi:hypothetical protein
MPPVSTLYLGLRKLSISAFAISTLVPQLATLDISAFVYRRYLFRLSALLCISAFVVDDTVEFENFDIREILAIRSMRHLLRLFPNIRIKHNIVVFVF